MAVLKHTHKQRGIKDSELRKQIEADLLATEKEIDRLLCKQEQLKKDLIGLDIKPFKIGGYAMCEIPAGRKTKWQKCLLEVVRGILYVRPVSSEDNIPLNRHFSIIPVGDKTYHAYLRKVEE